MAYATAAQLAAWMGQAAPADADRLLTRASEDIDDALLTALYRVDDEGKPTDPDIVEALADATCAQVEYQQASGDDGTGAAGRWDSVSIGPVSMSGRSDTAHGPAGLDLAPRALRRLHRAGLLPGVIW
ncbi:hypothetical protein ACFVAQ_45075 [Streptomyces sp. NPDC057651]|uniref:hypothetical protein n=1 Tax=Streptomyces sp. NPDC057651 TaxID=3346194 RepID=UPI0036BA9857